MRPLSELPNTEGFRFVGIRTMGAPRVECVVRRIEGIHLIFAASGERLFAVALQGWEPMSTNKPGEKLVSCEECGTEHAPDECPL